MSDLLSRLREAYEAGLTLTELELCHDVRTQPESLQLRPAAVLAAITDRDTPGVIMIHRPSNMRAHPGQIAFPGGKVDTGETVVEAALREAWEELGIRPADVRVIGTGDTYWTATGYDITPVIGVVPPDIELIPNPTEVAQWFEAPLDFLLDPVNHQQGCVERNGTKHLYWGIPWQGHDIWGATAGMIVNLSRRLRWHA